MMESTFSIDRVPPAEADAAEGSSAVPTSAESPAEVWGQPDSPQHTRRPHIPHSSFTHRPTVVFQEAKLEQRKSLIGPAIFPVYFREVEGGGGRLESKRAPSEKGGRGWEKCETSWEGGAGGTRGRAPGCPRPKTPRRNPPPPSTRPSATAPSLSYPSQMASFLPSPPAGRSIGVQHPPGVSPPPPTANPRHIPPKINPLPPISDLQAFEFGHPNKRNKLLFFWRLGLHHFSCTVFFGQCFGRFQVFFLDLIFFFSSGDLCFFLRHAKPPGRIPPSLPPSLPVRTTMTGG